MLISPRQILRETDPQIYHRLNLVQRKIWWSRQECDMRGLLIARNAPHTEVHDDVTPSIYFGFMSMPLSQELRIACPSCANDLRHCHGTALAGDGAHVCSDDPECTLSVDEHWFVALDEH